MQQQHAVVLVKINGAVRVVEAPKVNHKNHHNQESKKGKYGDEDRLAFAFFVRGSHTSMLMQVRESQGGDSRPVR